MVNRSSKIIPSGEQNLVELLMKRIVIFSTPTDKNLRVILSSIFPPEIKNKVFAYMPSNGADCPLKYKKLWEIYAKDNKAKFLYIDNSKIGKEAEKEKRELFSANILTITGGNTFTLLRNLRRSGLDKTIIEFSKKPEFVLSGFSAGAVVLTPTIAIANTEGCDSNDIDLKNLAGLNILHFEIFPHYSKEWEESVANYEKTTQNKVKKLTDDDYLVIDL